MTQMHFVPYDTTHTTAATTNNRSCPLESSTRWEAQQTCKTADEAG